MAENNISKLTTLKLSLEWDGNLSTLQQHLDKVNQIIKAATRKNASLANQLTKEEFNYVLSMRKRLNSSIVIEDKKRIKAIETAERNSIKAIEKQAKDSAKATAKAQKDAAEGSIKVYISKWQAAFLTLTRYLTAGALIASIVNIGKKGITAFLEIESALAKVRAMTGASAAQQKELQSIILSTTASIGIATKEVADFIIEMAKMGLGVEEIKDMVKWAGVLSSVLGEDLSSSGILMVTTMNQFNLSMSEAGRVAGTFYKVVKESPLAIEDLKIAMQYVGNAAQESGLQIEEVGVMLSFLSNRGLKASMIGTGLRNVFLKLAESGKTFKDVAREMSNEGLTLSEALEKFGIRGSTAAEIIINNWGQIEDMMENSFPNATESFISQMIATDSKMSWFARQWGMFYALISGDQNALQSGANSDIFRDLDGELRKVGKTIGDVFKLIEENKGKIGQDSLAKIIAEKLGIDYGDIKITGAGAKYADGIKGAFDNPNVRAINDIIKMQTEEIRQTEELKKWNSYYDKKVKEIIAWVGKDVAKQTEGRAKIEALYEDMRKDLMDDKTADTKNAFTQAKYNPLEDVGGDFDIRIKDADEATKKARLFIESSKTNLNTSIADIRDIKQLVADYNKLLGELLVAPANFSEEPAYAEKEKEKDDIAEFLCKRHSKELAQMGLSGICKNGNGSTRKSSKDDWRATMNAHIKAIKGDLTELQRLTDKELSDAMNDINGDNASAKMSFGDVKNIDEFFEKDLNILGIPNIAKHKDEYISHITDAANLYAKTLIDTAQDSTDAVERAYIETVNNKNASIEKIQKIIDEAKANPTLFGDAENNATWVENNQTQLDLLKSSLIDDEAEFKKSINDIAVKFSLDAKQIDLIMKNLFMDMNKAIPENVNDKIKKSLKLVSEALGEISDIVISSMESAQERKEAAYADELDAVQKRYDEETDIIDSANKNNLMSQEAYELAKRQLDKKRIDDENKINEELFESKKKQDIANAEINGAAMAAQAFIASFTANAELTWGAAAIAAAMAAVVVAKTAIQVGQIQKRKFYPQKYEEGGIIEGASHDNGGVPFTVRGSSVKREMEGGEFLIRKSRVTPETLPILKSINNSDKYSPTYFDNGGSIPSYDGNMDRVIDKITKTPIRAFITTRDLDNNEKRKAKTEKRTILWK